MTDTDRLDRIEAILIDISTRLNHIERTVCIDCTIDGCTCTNWTWQLETYGRRSEDTWVGTCIRCDGKQIAKCKHCSSYANVRRLTREGQFVFECVTCEKKNATH